jgi:hypothetical protein
MKPRARFKTSPAKYRYATILYVSNAVNYAYTTHSTSKYKANNITPPDLAKG